jgi:hypothetical protein
MIAGQRKPNFLFLGPDKTGSTWIFNLLRSHPAAFVPPAKDIYFFDRYWHLGWDWYLSFFSDVPASAKAVGEISHDYLFSRDAAIRIADSLQGVRLLTCLRHPVERSFSQYLYMLRGGERLGDFRSAVSAHPEIIENSMYSTHLAPWLQLFPKDSFKILLFDDLERDPVAFGTELLTFLDLEVLPDLPYRSKSLEGGRARVRWVARTLRLGANAARHFGMANLVGRVKHSRLQRLFYTGFEKGQRPTLSPTDRAWSAKLFTRDLDQLEGILGRPLSHWRA